MGWSKVMKAWGTGKEKVVGKNFELLFNAGLSEDEAKNPDLRGAGRAKARWGRGWGGHLFKKSHTSLAESVP